MDRKKTEGHKNGPKMSGLKNRNRQMRKQSQVSPDRRVSRRGSGRQLKTGTRVGGHMHPLEEEEEEQSKSLPLHRGGGGRRGRGWRLVRTLFYILESAGDTGVRTQMEDRLGWLLDDFELRSGCN